MLAGKMHVAPAFCPAVAKETICANLNGVIEQEASPLRSMRGAESHARSILKAVSWRALGTMDTFAISWLMTGKVHIAGSIAGIELGTKVAWYYLHERVWTAIRWGLRRH